MSTDNNPDLPREQQLEASPQPNQEGQLAERRNAELREERRRGQPDRRRWPRIGAVTRRAAQQAP